MQQANNLCSTASIEALTNRFAATSISSTNAQTFNRGGAHTVNALTGHSSKQDLHTRLLALFQKTGYSMIQENGQRKYGGPPPDWEGPPPSRGCEIFVGKIPRDLMEDELVPVFEKVGRLYELRLMMDFSGSNRGFAFVTYAARDAAKRACKELNNFEIRKNHHIGVVPSVDNCRLFVGGIPRNKSKDEVKSEMERLTDGVVDVILYPAHNDKSKNRGFAFVEYESHRSAAMARRKLVPGKVQLWNQTIAVDWAEPEQDVDEDTMSQVRILYVRNLMLNTSEEKLKFVFEQVTPGQVERIKKIKDYAFVHFLSRNTAIEAMDKLSGTEIDGASIEIMLAKPPDRTIMKYVKNAQKMNGIDDMRQGNVHQQIVTAAAHLASTSGFAGQQTGGGGPYTDKRLPKQSRSAAGLRSASARQAVSNALRNVVHGGFSKQSVQMMPMEALPLYRIAPQVNPISAATGIPFYMSNSRTSLQLLSELCVQNMWGQPQYTLQTTVTKDDVTGQHKQFYIYKVVIPALPHLGVMDIGRLLDNADEAKESVAQLALLRLNVSLVQTAEQQQQQQQQQQNQQRQLITMGQFGQSTQGNMMTPTTVHAMHNGNQQQHQQLANFSMMPQMAPPMVTTAHTAPLIGQQLFQYHPTAYYHPALLTARTDIGSTGSQSQSEPSTPSFPSPTSPLLSGTGANVTRPF